MKALEVSRNRVMKHILPFLVVNAVEAFPPDGADNALAECICLGVAAFLAASISIARAA